MDGGFFSPRYSLPFNTRRLPHIFCDVVVLGAGAAGLRAAAAARDFGEVMVLAKDAGVESNTAKAQGGVASVLDGSDSFERHVEDTLAAGAGLCDEAVVRFIIGEGPAEIALLESWGLRFDRENGRISLTREGGHSHRRVAHAGGDATGRKISETMLAHVSSLAGVTIIERWFAVDVLTDPGDGSVAGVLVLRDTGDLAVLRTKAVVIASGGLGRMYRETTNPNVATGDGIAMAYRAGARLRDLEFMQFHPTSLYLPGVPRFLISEAVRGEGAVLRDASGTAFMAEYDKSADLAPRDVVSRSIQAQMKKTESTCVFLDMRGIQEVDPVARFPGIAAELGKYNLDISRDLIPVRPSAHYLIGGVECGRDGATSVPGLYACGEAASTGLHGANRLGSNSLLEALVTGRRAGEAAGLRFASVRKAGNGCHIEFSTGTREDPGLNVEDAENSVRALMWRNVGIERTASGLVEAVEKTAFWSGYVLPVPLPERRALELKNMLILARLTARNALWREETRGVHYRLDFPSRDDAKFKCSNYCEPLSGAAWNTVRGGDLARD